MVRRLTLKRYNVKLASHEKSPAGGCLLDSRGPGGSEIVESLRRRPRLVPKSGILREIEGADTIVGILEREPTTLFGDSPIPVLAMMQSAVENALKKNV